MLNNLTTKFQEALMQAQQTAGRLGKPEISSLDVLVALLEQEGGILSPILRKASCDPGLLLQAALPFYNYFTRRKENFFLTFLENSSIIMLELFS